MNASEPIFRRGNGAIQDLKHLCIHSCLATFPNSTIILVNLLPCVHILKLLQGPLKPRNRMTGFPPSERTIAAAEQRMNSSDRHLHAPREGPTPQKTTQLKPRSSVGDPNGQEHLDQATHSFREFGHSWWWVGGARAETCQAT